MFSEIYYNKIQIYVIKIFEMTHTRIKIYVESCGVLHNLYALYKYLC